MNTTTPNFESKERTILKLNETIDHDIKCPACNSKLLTKTSFDPINNWPNVSIKIVPEKLKLIIESGKFERRLEDSEFYACYAYDTPKRPMSSNMVNIFFFGAILLYAFSASILGGIILLLIFLFYFGKNLKSEEKSFLVRQKKYLESLKTATPKRPIPPKKNLTWEYQAGYAFFVLYTIFVNKNNEFSGYLMTFIAIICYPVFLPSFILRQKIKYKVLLQAHNQVVESWPESVMCQSCGRIYVKK